MELVCFIHDLLSEGRVTLSPDVADVNEGSPAAVVEELLGFYASDSQDLAGQPPAFDEDAAIWAARYFFRAVKLLVNRETGAEQVEAMLAPYPGLRTAATSYSVDLVFRHLVPLSNLAKGLAPADILVAKLKEQMENWPLSSVGSGTQAEMDGFLLTDDSIRQLYVDRIILSMDLDRANNKTIEPYVTEVVGEHSPLLWPGYDKVK